MYWGGHYILIDYIEDVVKNKNQFYKKNLKIDDKFCMMVCDYDKVVQINNANVYEIYHVALDGPNERYGIYVNGGFFSELTSEKNLKKIRFFHSS